VQVRDTGGAYSPGRGSGVSLLAGQDVSGIAGGLFDDPAVDSVGGSGDPMRGIGVPPPVPVGELESSVRRALRTRPLGLCRLLLIRPIITAEAMADARPKSVARIVANVDQWLVYASPLMRMHQPAPNENFNPARLAWSLRQMPGRESLQGVWLVYIPQGGLSQAMMSSGRAAKIDDLVNAAGGLGGVSRSAFLSARTMPISVITSNLDGTTSVPFRRPKNPKNGSQSSGMHDAMKALMDRAPWDKETGTFGSTPYFSGEF
jgi:hypothetical protein